MQRQRKQDRLRVCDIGHTTTHLVTSALNNVIKQKVVPLKDAFFMDFTD